MKYNIVFKFLAIALCALMLLGAAGSAAAIIGMTESGLYDISVEELRDRYIRSDGESMAGRIAVDYAEANLGGVPERSRGRPCTIWAFREEAAGFTACSTRRWRAMC